MFHFASILQSIDSIPRKPLSSLMRKDADGIALLIRTTFRPLLARLASCGSAEATRAELFSVLNEAERELWLYGPEGAMYSLHPFEKANAKECLRVIKNFIKPGNEALSGFSLLEALVSLGEGERPARLGKGFLIELYHLLLGAFGRSGLHDVLSKASGAGAAERTAILDGFASSMKASMARYKHGLMPEEAARAARNKALLLEAFGGGEEEWASHRWQLHHIIRRVDTLERFVKLSEAERRGLELADKYGVPFHITPYYLSLFDFSGPSESDRAIRAQVLPSEAYCEQVARNRAEGLDMDFMGERETSPIELITRRYPQIVILKPIDACPQICVYCQRNWEIKAVDEASVSSQSVMRAIEWIKGNESIEEVLVTGGDPLMLGSAVLKHILDGVASIPHVERIRIGTRIPVTMPMRVTEGLASMLASYVEPGRREVCVITHVAHPAEITADLVACVGRLKAAGLPVYNQQVFTYYNSRRFETCLLRKRLRLAGIDPYYSFNTKGKDETKDFRVPIARLEQERKEEARLLPGLARTDEPVFNVPKMGKSHLRAWQDHEPLMLMPDGSRIYGFIPWDSRLALSDEYDYVDVGIHDYLERLMAEGEDIDQYASIWYYF